jgi:hypothetical protein
MTTHNHTTVVPLAKEGVIDYFHIRYNAVHRGAEEDIFAHLPWRQDQESYLLQPPAGVNCLKRKNSLTE